MNPYSNNNKIQLNLIGKLIYGFAFFVFNLYSLFYTLKAIAIVEKNKKNDKEKNKERQRERDKVLCE